VKNREQSILIGAFRRFFLIQVILPKPLFRGHVKEAKIVWRPQWLWRTLYEQRLKSITVTYEIYPTKKKYLLGRISGY